MGVEGLAMTPHGLGTAGVLSMHLFIRQYLFVSTEYKIQPFEDDQTRDTRYKWHGYMVAGLSQYFSLDRVHVQTHNKSLDSRSLGYE